MTHILHYNSYIIYNKSLWCIGIAFLLCWIPINAINLLSDFLLLINMWVVNDTYTKNSNIRGIPRIVANRISRAVLGDKSFGQKWNKGGPNWPNRSKISWMAKSGPKILCQDIALKIIRKLFWNILNKNVHMVDICHTKGRRTSPKRMNFRNRSKRVVGLF